MSEQLSFAAAFAASEHEQATQHIPGELDLAVPYFRGLIERFNAAILAGDDSEANTINDEATELAAKLNGEDGTLGIMGGPDAPCYLLERATAAEPGSVPLWGQTGEFTIVIGDMKVRIELDGIYGLGAMPVPGFSANIVDVDKPFLSETGYRSFLGQYGPTLGLAPDAYVKAVIEQYLQTECMKKGKLVLRKIQPEYVERYKGAA